jgi:hypothetical protein
MERISNLNKYKPNKYEIEYKIVNKYSFFKHIQQFFQVERFEKSKISYYSLKSEKSINTNTSKENLEIRLIENSKDNIIEQKNVIIKNDIDIDTYPFKIRVKVSKESKLNEIDKTKYKLKNICYRYRLVFSLKDFPFEIDLSMRVFPKNIKTKVPTFSDEDVFNPVYIKSDDYSIVYDLEFELLPSYNGTNEDAFNKLIELFKKNNSDYPSSQNTKIKGSDLDEDKSIGTTSIRNEKIESLINLFNFDFTRTPQVSVLTNKIIDSIDLTNFVYLEKTDGLRTLLIYDGNVLYQFRNKEGLKELDLKLNLNNKFIVDSEFVDLNNENKYYVFDVYYVDSDIRELGFIERMNKFKDILSNNNSIILKEYKQVDISENKLSELIKYGMTKRPNVDGIVFQSKDGYSIKEWLKKDYQYKLKPLELTTTDFLYKWIESEKCYYLYLIGTFGELVFNLKARPRCLQKAYTPFNIDLTNISKEKSYMILFDTPLFDNMYKCEINNEDIKKYLESENKIDLTKEGCLDGLIIETSYMIKNREYQQTPIRIRWDKIKPNGYRIGITNACILFSPPTAENHYFHKITNEDVANTFKLNDFIKNELNNENKSVSATSARNENNEYKNKLGEILINSFHTINQYIRDYTFEKLNKLVPKSDLKYKTAFDLCGGRGSDLKRLYSMGYNNIIAADADAEALTIYSLKAIFYKTWNLNFGKLSLNCIHEPLGNDGKELNLIMKMKQRYEFKKCNLIIIDYALHYICDSNYENNLKNLVKIIKSVSNPGTFILINFYDGDKIIKRNGDFGIFKIKIESNENEIKAFMPLPTIEKDGYREEPLLLNKHIDLLKQEGLKIVKDYYPMDEIDINDFSNLDNDIGIIKNIYEYLKCIRSIIFKI